MLCVGLLVSMIFESFVFKLVFGFWGFFGYVEVGDCVFEGFGCYCYCFRECWMWMYGEFDVLCVVVYFDCQGQFIDEVIGVGFNDFGIDDVFCFGIEEEFGYVFVVVEGERLVVCSLWKDVFVEFVFLFVGFCFGDVDLGDFWIGVCDVWDDLCIEV